MRAPWGRNKDSSRSSWLPGAQPRLTDSPGLDSMETASLLQRRLKTAIFCLHLEVLSETQSLGRATVSRVTHDQQAKYPRGPTKQIRHYPRFPRKMWIDDLLRRYSPIPPVSRKEL